MIGGRSRRGGTWRALGDVRWCYSEAGVGDLLCSGLVSMGLVRAGGLLATISLGCSDSYWLWRSCWCADIRLSALAVPDVFAETGVQQSVDLGVKSIIRTIRKQDWNTPFCRESVGTSRELDWRGRASFRPFGSAGTIGIYLRADRIQKKIKGWPATNQTDAHLLPEAAAIACLARSSSLLLSLHSHLEWNRLERRAARHWSHWVRGRPFFLISKRARSE
jgi:hypothetical protein